MGDSLFTSQKNDLSFIINGKLVVLVEHQSSINENMPFRFLQPKCGDSNPLRGIERLRLLCTPGALSRSGGAEKRGAAGKGHQAHGGKEGDTGLQGQKPVSGLLGHIDNGGYKYDGKRMGYKHSFGSGKGRGL